MVGEGQIGRVPFPPHFLFFEKNHEVSRDGAVPWYTRQKTAPKSFLNPHLCAHGRKFIFPSLPPSLPGSIRNRHLFSSSSFVFPPPRDPLPPPNAHIVDLKKVGGRIGPLAPVHHVKVELCNSIWVFWLKEGGRTIRKPANGKLGGTFFLSAEHVGNE